MERFIKLVLVGLAVVVGSTGAVSVGGAATQAPEDRSESVEPLAILRDEREVELLEEEEPTPRPAATRPVRATSRTT